MNPETEQVNGDLQYLLQSFERYYTVHTDGVEPPFSAFAEFKTHAEQYFLVKAAKVSDIDSNEYVYFSQEGELSQERLGQLVSEAWNRGLSLVKPYWGHKNSDVTLIVCTSAVSPEASSLAKKIRLYRSYCWSFKGYSHFRLMVWETGTGRTFCNRMGRDLARLIKK